MVLLCALFSRDCVARKRTGEGADMAAGTATGMATDNSKLSFGEKLVYGLGDTASNFYWQMFLNFLAFFYTDIFGITAAAAATMFLVVRIPDTFIDPVMGVIADRTQTRWDITGHICFGDACPWRDGGDYVYHSQPRTARQADLCIRNL